MPAKLLDRVCQFLAVLAAIYLVVIMGGIVFQATARSLGFSGSSHIFTFTEFGLLYIVMLASPWLVRERGHVFIEILTAAVPAERQRILSRLIAGLSVVICVVFAWYAGEATVKSFIRGDADMRSVDMPRWLLLGTMPICFGLMALQFLRFTFGAEVMHTGEAGVHE